MSKAQDTAASKSAPDGAVLVNLTTTIVLSATLATAALFGTTVSSLAYPMAMYLVTNVVVTFFWRRTPDNAVKNAVGIWMTVSQWLYLLVAAATMVLGDVGGIPVIRTVAALGLLGVTTVSLSFCMVWISSQHGIGQFKSIAATGAAMFLAAIAVVAPLANRYFATALAARGHGHGSSHQTSTGHKAESTTHESVATDAHASTHVEASEPAAAHSNVMVVASTGDKHHSDSASSALPSHDGHAAPSPSGSHGGTNKNAHAVPHWSYKAGPQDPAHWGKLADNFSACTKGTEQSPIEIPRTSPLLAKYVLPFILPSTLRVIDNGHTVQVNYDNGSKVVVNGKAYETKQMHFHSPSEHEINGVSFPIEFHIVNKSVQGQLAVLGIMVEKGRPNAELEKMLANLPESPGPEKVISGVVLNLSKLLPKVRSVYNYPGSLTTPPCSEGVNWNVFAQPIEASQAQITALQNRYFHNNRPIQPINSRRIGQTSRTAMTSDTH